jgi:hypothetical protein
MHGPYAHNPISHPNPIFSAMKKQSIVPPLSKTGLDYPAYSTTRKMQMHVEYMQMPLELLHLQDHPPQQQQKFFIILHHIATLHIQVID